MCFIGMFFFNECFYNIKEKRYPLFADALVDLVLKALFDSSERHVSVIFGDVLTETEGDRGKKERGE